MVSGKEKNPAAVALGRRGGKVGGRSKSKAKAASSRANGAKGGRPPKPCECPYSDCGHVFGHHGRRTLAHRTDTLPLEFITVCEDCLNEHSDTLVKGRTVHANMV